MVVAAPPGLVGEDRAGVPDRRGQQQSAADGAQPDVRRRQHEGDEHAADQHHDDPQDDQVFEQVGLVRQVRAHRGHDQRIVRDLHDRQRGERHDRQRHDQRLLPVEQRDERGAEQEQAGRQDLGTRALDPEDARRLGQPPVAADVDRRRQAEQQQQLREVDAEGEPLDPEEQRQAQTRAKIAQQAGQRVAHADPAGRRVTRAPRVPR